MKTTLNKIKEALAEDEADALTITYMAGLRDGKKTNKREWVNLTDEEISAASKGHITRNGFARVVEALLKKKNHG